MALLLRGLQLPGGGLRCEPVAVELGRCDEAVLGQLLAALQFEPRLLDADARALDAHARAHQLRLRALNPCLRLARAALVEQRRHHGRQRGQHRAGRDRVALAQRDARQAARQRRRDDVALGQARLAVFVDRLLECADSGRGHLHFHRPRRKGPGDGGDGDHAGGDGEDQVAFVHRHSLVLSAATMSNLSMRRRTTSALAAADARTASAAQA